MNTITSISTKIYFIHYWNVAGLLHLTVMKLKPMWDDINEDVYKWFDRYQAATLRSSLLQDKRPDAGKNYYCNSANESINKYLNMETNRKSAMFDNRRMVKNKCLSAAEY